jgi:hypothetical protein
VLTEPPTSNVWRRRLVELAHAAYQEMHGIAADDVELDGRHEAVADGPAGSWRFWLVQRSGDGPTEGVGMLLPE